MAEVVKARKPKILVVCQHFWPESFRINDICDFFVEKGAEVDVLCGLPNYPEGKLHKGYSFFTNLRQQHNGINIQRVPEIPRGNNTSLRIFVNYLSFPFFSLFYIPWLLRKKYDKIFLYQLSPVMMTIAGIIVGKIRKTETTMYVLDLWPENLFSVLNIKNPFLRKFITNISHWHYRHVDKIIVLSERMKEKIIEVTSIANERIIVLPQTSEKIYETDIIDEGLVDKFKGGFNILYAGNISPAQSFETVIEAAKILQLTHGLDMRWIIVGDGMSRKWLEAEVHKADLSKIFHFEGQKPVADIPKYNHIADVLVGCLAKSDLLEATIPAKVMSYIASGKPMVLAMDGEVQNLVNNIIGCGIVGPAENSKVFAENIQKIHSLPDGQRNEMGQRARAYHFKYFERTIILNKLYGHIFNLTKV
ncbi:MAG: glycosyltransferase family 4 protein [Candidatus Saccharimonadales bacterium]